MTLRLYSDDVTSPRIFPFNRISFTISRCAPPFLCSARGSRWPPPRTPRCGPSRVGSGVSPSRCCVAITPHHHLERDAPSPAASRHLLPPPPPPPPPVLGASPPLVSVGVEVLKSGHIQHLASNLSTRSGRDAPVPARVVMGATVFAPSSSPRLLERTDTRGREPRTLTIAPRVTPRAHARRERPPPLRVVARRVVVVVVAPRRSMNDSRRRHPPFRPFRLRRRRRATPVL